MRAAHSSRRIAATANSEILQIAGCGRSMASAASDITRIMNRTDRHIATPNDFLWAYLLELAEKNGLSDSAIARAHNRAYDDSTLAASSVQRHRTHHPAGAVPGQLMEEAYAAATGTTREANWTEAIRRWRSALKQAPAA